MNVALKRVGEEAAKKTLDLGNWSIVAMTSKKARDAVLDMATIASSHHRLLFFFRAAQKKPYSTRVVAISRAVTETALPEIIKWFTNREEVSEVIGVEWAKTFDGTQTAEIFLKIRLETTKVFQVSELEVQVDTNTQRFPIKLSPHCVLCRGNDHRIHDCPWQKVKLGFELDRHWGNKPSQKAPPRGAVAKKIHAPTAPP